MNKTSMLFTPLDSYGLFSCAAAFGKYRGKLVSWLTPSGVRKRRARSGYILLVVLAVLTIATTLLVTAATDTHLVSLKALDAERALQDRWGTISVEAALLPKADEILETANAVQVNSGGSGNRESRLQDSISSVQFSVSLSEAEFSVLLADEDAKLNLNVLGASGDRLSVIPKGLMVGTAGLCLRPPRQPFESYSSWGEVFDLERLRKIDGDDRALASLTKSVTLWGSERINIQRTSRAAFVSLAASVLTQAGAERMWEDYQDSGRLLSAQQLAANHASDEEQELELLSIVRDGSQCFSIWIESVTKGGIRHQRLALQAVREDGIASKQVFVFD